MFSKEASRFLKNWFGHLTTVMLLLLVVAVVLVAGMAQAGCGDNNSQRAPQPAAPPLSFNVPNQFLAQPQTQLAAAQPQCTECMREKTVSKDIARETVQPAPQAVAVVPVQAKSNDSCCRRGPLASLRAPKNSFTQTQVTKTKVVASN